MIYQKYELNIFNILMKKYYIKYQKTNKKIKEKINCTRLNQINYIRIYDLNNNVPYLYKIK